jgi:hypothetical protein
VERFSLMFLSCHGCLRIEMDFELQSAAPLLAQATL